jgi:hypothetical protein
MPYILDLQGLGGQPSASMEPNTTETPLSSVSVSVCFTSLASAFACLPISFASVFACGGL